MRLLLSLGNDPNIQAETGRTALHGAGHKGSTAVIQVLVDAGAKLDARDYGMNGNDAGGRLKEHTWLPVDYAGPQPEFPGLDQLNVRLPRSLIGHQAPRYFGANWLGLTVDGKSGSYNEMILYLK